MSSSLWGSEPRFPDPSCAACGCLVPLEAAVFLSPPRRAYHVACLSGGTWTHGVSP